MDTGRGSVFDIHSITPLSMMVVAPSVDSLANMSPAGLVNALYDFLAHNSDDLVTDRLQLTVPPIALQILEQSKYMLEANQRDYPSGWHNLHVHSLPLLDLDRLLTMLRSVKNLRVQAPAPGLLLPGALDVDIKSISFDLSLFPELKKIEFRNFRKCVSMPAVRGLSGLRTRTDQLIVRNSLTSLSDLLGCCLADHLPRGEAEVWTGLKNFSCKGNELKVLDASLRLLPACEALDLSENALTSLDSLQYLPELKMLNLEQNKLTSLQGINYFLGKNIKTLSLRKNALSDSSNLGDIAQLLALEKLDLAFNKLASFTELAKLNELKHLRSVWLAGNPLARVRKYRAHVFLVFRETLNAPEGFFLDDILVIIYFQSNNTIIVCGIRPTRQVTPPERAKAFSVNQEIFIVKAQAALDQLLDKDREKKRQRAEARVTNWNKIQNLFSRHSRCRP
jgi:hypothetical protein